MTKLNELKAAYEAATPGEWERRGSQIHCRRVLLARCQFGPEGDQLDPEAAKDANFIALAHNMMPQLLEAVELLKELRNSLSQYDDGEWYLHDGTEPRLDYIDEVLGKLK